MGEHTDKQDEVTSMDRRNIVINVQANNMMLQLTSHPLDLI